MTDSSHKAPPSSWRGGGGGSKSDVHLEISDGNDISETSPLLGNLRVSKTSPSLSSHMQQIDSNHSIVPKLKPGSSASAKQEIDSIKLTDEIRGALIFHIS
eukprot:110782_1